MGYYRPWAFWRRMQYGGGVAVFFIALFTAFYYAYLFEPASCFDGIQNQGEEGVDCGGPCVRICTASVEPPRIEWVQAFEIGSGQYNAAAYVTNPNVTAGTPELSYTFLFYDERDQLIKERAGSTELPPNVTIPIFQGRIDSRSRTIGRTEIRIESADLWLPVVRGRDQFAVLQTELLGAETQPRLNANIQNRDPAATAERVDLVATIFDSLGNPLTSSATFVENLSPNETRSTFFTWPNPIARTIRACEVPSDIMIILDRSGSMAADGGDPPEPLESTKRAAETFAMQTGARDRLGYLSYATTPSDPIDQELTNSSNAVVEAISRTRLGTDGTQFTDMGAAFRAAEEELRSERSRDGVRKVMVFLTDGDVTRPVNPETGQRDIPYARQYALDNAQASKDAGTTIYTIGFGDFFLEIDGVLDRDVGLIEELASSPDKTFTAPTLSDLERVYTEIAEDICEDGPTRIEVIPVTGADFVPMR